MWQENSFAYTLKDNSKFSPPHTRRPGSYAPNSRKYSLLIANKPPAWVGDLQKENYTSIP